MALSRYAKDNHVYDGKRLWETWCDWGKAASYLKLQRWCDANGMYDPGLGKASTMGPCWAMWRYVAQNLREAFPGYQAWINDHTNEIAESGFEPTWENFLKEVNHHAKQRTVLSRPSYLKWCKEHGLEPYPEKEDETAPLEKQPA